MPKPESGPRPPHPSPSDVSMRDLLASCVAAAAVSTPPKWPTAVEAPAVTGVAAATVAEASTIATGPVPRPRRDAA
jgi:hypothetical protein